MDENEIRHVRRGSVCGVMRMVALQLPHQRCRRAGGL